jgi:peptide/nickel transport system ATP-binding protein/oligopeptide transport system ATP-binding protein
METGLTAPTEHLLEVEGLRTYFHTFDGLVKAVDEVSFFIDRNETVALVGESGCGKSVTAQSIMGLIPVPPGRIEGGRILFNGQDLTKISLDEMIRLRGRRLAMIFQEPMSSLNPVLTIGDQIAEMFLVHRSLPYQECMSRAVEMLRLVQIPSPEHRIYDYPHQLSGGMRQRAMIAMALACNPDLVIADEPTTALDVTIQAQILELMGNLRNQFEAAILLITHDLGVVAEIAQRTVVMYAGRVVEEGPTRTILKEAAHPYTHGLLRSLPRLGERSTRGRQRLTEIKGMVPSLYSLPPGCSFQERCPRAFGSCRQMSPELVNLRPDHKVRCLLYGRNE